MSELYKSLVFPSTLFSRMTDNYQFKLDIIEKNMADLRLNEIGASPEEKHNEFSCSINKHN